MPEDPYLFDPNKPARAPRRMGSRRRLLSAIVRAKVHFPLRCMRQEIHKSDVRRDPEIPQEQEWISLLRLIWYLCDDALLKRGNLFDSPSMVIRHQHLVSG